MTSKNAKNKTSRIQPGPLVLWVFRQTCNRVVWIRSFRLKASAEALLSVFATREKYGYPVAGWTQKSVLATYIKPNYCFDREPAINTRIHNQCF